MLAIAHFAVGISAAFAILIFFPKFARKYLGNLIKNDVFFVLGSGFFAMLPDLNKVFINPTLEKIHSSALSNIFWGHGFLDTYPKTIGSTVFMILIAIILTSYYFKKIK